MIVAVVLALTLVGMVGYFLQWRNKQRSPAQRLEAGKSSFHFFVNMIKSHKDLHGNITLKYAGEEFSVKAHSVKRRVILLDKEGDPKSAILPPVDVVEAPVVVEILNPEFFSAVIAQGNLGLGESYMRGWLKFENGSMTDLIVFFLRNRIDSNVDLTWATKFEAFKEWVYYRLTGHAHALYIHYGVNEDLYRDFLGEYMVYTCGFANPEKLEEAVRADLRSKLGKNGAKLPSAVQVSEDWHPHISHADLNLDLDEIQQRKLEKVCKKLQLKPGQRLLDVGCGFGGLSIYAAKTYGVQTVGFALVEFQIRRARELAQVNGVAKQTTFHFRDLKILAEFEDESFDAIAPIGVFEHVHLHEYEHVFSQFKRILKPHGRVLIHAISAPILPTSGDPFIQKYIFPNSRQMVISEVAAAIEKKCMTIIDLENIGQHYYYTLRCWLQNSQAHFAKHPGKYPDEFIKTWEHYLECCMAFSSQGDASLAQILFTKGTRAQRTLDRDLFSNNNSKYQSIAAKDSWFL